MRCIFILSLLLTFIFFTACKDAGKKEEERLKDEIFAIHDEVMPATSDIMRLSRKIRSIKKKNPDLSKAEVAELDSALVQLETAHDKMMVWMKNFKSPAKLRSSRTHEEILDYLQQEKKNIEDVRDAMLQSMETGEAALKNYKQ